MTDDPNAAFVTPGRTHLSMTTDALTRDTVRAALVELLTIGQHHDAANLTTLSAVGNTRRALAHQHGTHDPTAPFALDDQRLAALNHALETVNRTPITLPPPQRPDTAGLRDGLSELAAIALSWLDTLPVPRRPDPEAEPS